MSDTQIALNEAGAMRQAIALADRGWGRVHPNPMVGAVVIRDRQVIGEGWHAEFGGMHAERAALSAAGQGTRGATLVTTLEPCTHHGKQPPCIDAIIASGVVRVVIAIRDPNPEAGGGMDRLSAAGVKVVLGVEDVAARRQNFRFLRRFWPQERPFVAVKLAVTMDGMIADQEGNSQWISGNEAREWVHHERAGYGAIAVGAETAILDDARLTVRGSVMPRVPPVRVIFDRSGKLPGDHGIFADAAIVPVYVVHHPATPSAIAPREGVTLLPAASLTDALAELARRGIDAILVEGGGRLAGQLLRQGLVDRVYQLQSPVWLGQGRPAWAELGERTLADAIRWHTAERRVLGDDTLLVMER
jgi:diaminohydroxyphosphoribosylaminopyrimidine deaminase/5-amino-6-(5-phosphoribosylamino)uracil reductase